jgi:hypothetical protein
MIVNFYTYYRSGGVHYYCFWMIEFEHYAKVAWWFHLGSWTTGFNFAIRLLALEE